MGTMRLCELWEKDGIPMTSQNPLKENSLKYCAGINLGAPPCEEWLLAEYTGKTHYPHYKVSIIASKFKSESDALKTESIIKEWNKGRQHQVNARTFSRPPFIVLFGTTQFLDEAHRQEHLARTNLYQRKRGLRTYP